jgi:hypothetical protein
MKYKVFTKICLRLIALYFFMTYIFYGITIISYLLKNLGNPDEQVDIGSVFAVMPMAIMAVISILLWIFAGKIANNFVGKEEDNDCTQNIDYDKVQYIGFCIVGVLVIANAIPNLSSCIYQLAEMSKMQIDYGNRLYSTYIEKLISAVLQSVIGIWLVFGTKGILNAIKKIRTIGHKEEAEL